MTENPLKLDALAKQYDPKFSQYTKSDIVNSGNNVLLHILSKPSQVFPKITDSYFSISSLLYGINIGIW